MKEILLNEFYYQFKRCFFILSERRIYSLTGYITV